MTKITWKPGTMLYPLPPALISSGTVEKPNMMTVAWTGIISSDPVMTYVSIRPSRYSHDIIKESGEFVINLPTWDMVTAVDYCGVKSGRDIDKFTEMKLTALASSKVQAPQIAEAPVSLECKVKSITNYGTHDMFLAEVVAVNVDDKYIDEKGALDLEKAGLVAFAHGKYYTLGRNLGSFGFSVNKARLKQMQKAEKVEVTVKKTRRAAPSVEELENAKPRRSPFGTRRPADRSGERRDGGKRPYSRDGEDRRTRDENRRPFNRDGGERRDFRGDGEQRSRDRNEGSRGDRRPARRDEDRPFRGRDGEKSYRPQRSPQSTVRSFRRQDGDVVEETINRLERRNDRPRKVEVERRPARNTAAESKPRKHYGKLKADKK